MNVVGRRSSLSLISLSYPNFLKTVHVVSKRPFSIKRACRKRNPVNVSPCSFTPSGIFSCTTIFTPVISDGWRGALKHLTWKDNRQNCYHCKHQETVRFFQYSKYGSEKCKISTKREEPENRLTPHH